jgi:hypothetical protein
MILRLRQMHLASRCILIRSWPYEQRRISKLSAPERGVYAASLSLLSQLSLNPNLAGSFTLKRPEGRAPANRQGLDEPPGHAGQFAFRQGTG